MAKRAKSAPKAHHNPVFVNLYLAADGLHPGNEHATLERAKECVLPTAGRYLGTLKITTEAEFV